MKEPSKVIVFTDFSDSEMNLRDDKFEKAKTNL
jgi:hypothetical protein